MTIKKYLTALLERFKHYTDEELIQMANELVEIAIKLENENNSPKEQQLSHAKLILAMGVLRQRGVKLAL